MALHPVHRDLRVLSGLGLPFPGKDQCHKATVGIEADKEAYVHSGVIHRPQGFPWAQILMGPEEERRISRYGN